MYLFMNVSKFVNITVTGKVSSPDESSDAEPEMPTFKTEPLSDDEDDECGLEMNLKDTEHQGEKFHFTKLETPYHASDRNSPFSGMSLDVLAQVASATLENEPDMPIDLPQKKVSTQCFQ